LAEASVPYDSKISGNSVIMHLLTLVHSCFGNG
jgi:hypothetical protein